MTLALMSSFRASDEVNSRFSRRSSYFSQIETTFPRRRIECGLVHSRTSFRLVRKIHQRKDRLQYTTSRCGEACPLRTGISLLLSTGIE